MLTSMMLSLFIRLGEIFIEFCPLMKSLLVILETTTLPWLEYCGAIGGDVGGAAGDDAGDGNNFPSPSYNEHQNCNNRCLNLRCHRP